MEFMLWFWKKIMKIQSRFEDLFIIPIGIYKYPHHKELKGTIYNIIEKYTNTEYEMDRDKGGIRHFFNHYNQDLFRSVKGDIRDCLDSFEYFLKYSINHYYQNVFGVNHDGDMLITNSWLNITRRGNWLEPHFHGNSIISANYFASAEDGFTPLQFCNPFHQPHGACPSFSIEPDIDTPYSVRTVPVNTKEGELVVWNSGLFHGFGAVDNDKERITIAMNCSPDSIKTGPYKITIGACDESN